MKTIYRMTIIAAIASLLIGCQSLEMSRGFDALFPTADGTESTAAAKPSEDIPTEGPVTAVDVEETAETVPDTPDEADDAPAVEDIPVVVEAEAVPEEVPLTASEPMVARQTTGDIAFGNSIPDWYVYVFSALFLSLLFTVCYISKQRKESMWHRYRD